MPYTINRSDPSQPPIVISDVETDTSTSLTLLGRNFAGYGTIVAENFVYLLENFSNATAPSQGAPLKGQLWYNSGTSTLMLYNGSAWIAIATAASVASLGQPPSPTPLMDGIANSGTGTYFARNDHVHPTDTSLATTASLQSLAAPPSPTPLMDGVANSGTGTHFARNDHVHPTDTSLAPRVSPAFTGIPIAPTAAPLTSTSQIATTAYVQNALGTGFRIKLLANQNFYINASTGNDSGTGTISSPWRTIQFAVNHVQAIYDLCGNQAFFLCTGTFTEQTSVSGPFTGQTTPFGVIFDGGGTSTVSVPSSATCFYCFNGNYVVQNFSLTTIGPPVGSQGDCLACSQGSILHLGNTFLSCSANHIIANGSGSYIQAIGHYTISGGAVCHINAGSLGFITTGGASPFTVNLLGNPNFSDGFAGSSGNGVVDYGQPWVTFSGSATGRKYIQFSGSVIQTDGGGINYFPGDTPGADDGTTVYQ